MKPTAPDQAVLVFSTCPQSSDASGATYLKMVHQAAAWSERYGCAGMLVYSDNRLVDPWLVAHALIQETEHLCPLVAVQPVYLHPYALAKLVASLAHLYGRRVYLNMVAGGFVNDLVALGDRTQHDQRYERLHEYTEIALALLSEQRPVTREGVFYQVKNLKLSPSIPSDLLPGVFVSGSSSAGLAVAQALGATAITYAQPPARAALEGVPSGVPAGLRVGLIARDDARAAWDIAHRRFPEDRKGELTRELATKLSDSNWHKTLSAVSDDEAGGVYWMVPFHQYQTNCPYLVGSHDEVADALSRYIGIGFRTFILDIPPAEEDLYHSSVAFERAMALVER